MGFAKIEAGKTKIANGGGTKRFIIKIYLSRAEVLSNISPVSSKLFSIKII